MLWNIDQTLLDVTKVTRVAYAEAFAEVTGRPLVQLPQMVGYTEPEIFFDALGRNGVSLRADGDSERLLAPFGSEFATRLAARKNLLTEQGTLMPGAAEAVRAVAGLAERCPVGAHRVESPERDAQAPRLRPGPAPRPGHRRLRGLRGLPQGRAAARRPAAGRGEVPGELRRAGDRSTSPTRPATWRRPEIGGATSVAVASGRASSAELRDAGADAVLRDLTDSEALVALITSAGS